MVTFPFPSTIESLPLSSETMTIYPKPPLQQGVTMCLGAGQ